MKSFLCNLFMGGYRICGLAEGVEPNDAATVSQLGGFDTVALQVQFDGGGAEIEDGQQVRVYCPFPFEIEEWTFGADQSGSIVVDIWADTHSNYPPVVGDSIVASAKPTISSAVKAQSSTLTGWDVEVAEDTWLIFNVDSCTSIEAATLCLKVKRV